MIEILIQFGYTVVIKWQRGDVAMIAKWFNYMSRLHDGVDAILITNRDGTVEYSAMFSEREKRLMDEGIIGKNILEVYPQLTKETSSHFRVMRTGKPILNEKQILTDFRGVRRILVNSTFPLEYEGKIIGTMETSVAYSKESQLDGKNHWMSKPHKGLYVLDDIITQDADMQALKETALRVAPNDSPVLIWGETGTGKELFAQALHSHSKRSSGPFISQNCAAIPFSLLESTLFGTAKGSYTGAENKKGLLQLADGGTLFLDEVNSMDLALQAKILRAIEEKKFRPVGGEKDIRTDVRIVSAMNVDPISAVREGLLRKDLFYRLGVVQLPLPPLRKRINDIQLLTKFFLQIFNQKLDRNITDVSDLVKNLFSEYEWPGNVRELRNTIESAFNLCTGNTIQLNDIPSYIVYDQNESLPQPAKIDELDQVEELGLQEAVRQYEKRMICRALESSRTVTDAAAKLKLTRQALQYKITKYHLD